MGLIKKIIKYKNNRFWDIKIVILFLNEFNSEIQKM